MALNMRRDTRELLIAAPIVLVAVVGTMYGARFAQEHGVGGTVFAVYGLTGLAVAVVVLNTKHRRRDRTRWRASLLLLAGFTCLACSTLLNEYAFHLFTVSRVHVFLALAPALIYLAYCAFRDRHLTNRSSDDGPEGPRP